MTPGKRVLHLPSAGVMLAFVAGAAVAALGLGYRRAPKPAPPPGGERPKWVRIDHLKQVTRDDGVETSASIAPDGTSFVYASRGRASASWDIYRKLAFGESATNLTADAKDDDVEPALSPDGARIAFRSTRDGGGIFVMGAAGDSVRRIADLGFHPSWSPDGREIVFAAEGADDPRTLPATDGALWAVDVASGERRKLVSGSAFDPAVSPNGRRVAYYGVHKGAARDIWTVPIGGGAPVRVTDDLALDWRPTWSPDGKWLYFSSDRGGTMSLWRARIDEATGAIEGELRPFALNVGAWVSGLSFSRDGARAVFVASSSPLRALERPGEDAGDASTPAAAALQEADVWLADLK